MPDEKPPTPPIDWKREYMIQAKRNLIALSLLGGCRGVCFRDSGRCG